MHFRGTLRIASGYTAGTRLRDESVYRLDCNLDLDSAWQVVRLDTRLLFGVLLGSSFTTWTLSPKPARVVSVVVARN